MLLPPDYFECPPLSPWEIEQYIVRGTQSTGTLQKKAQLRGGMYDWALLKDDSELKIYKGYSDRMSGDSCVHCGVMQVKGELDECMDMHRYDTTEQARAYARRFGRAYADVVTLYKVLPRHPDRPNDCIQIKWVLTKSPLDGLVIKRDFVMLETDMELQVDGKRAWVRAFRSIELNCVPDMRQELGCIRGYMYDAGFLVVESDRPGYLDMTYLADLDFGGSVPSWMNDQSMKFWLRSMLLMDRLMREDRLSRTPFLHKDELCPLHLRHRCALCQRKFGPLRRKTNCVKCGEVLCRDCNREWHVNVQGVETKVRACAACSLGTSPFPQRTRSAVVYSSIVPPLRPPHLASSVEWSEPTPHGQANVPNDDDNDAAGDSRRQMILLEAAPLACQASAHFRPQD
ncbi:hypothetical protein LEN26_017874 [Aphanomyces euteiches]|nr:hypothetical protein LEN26_017874 [Aphanomyces euteiches]KAH9105946.1 hypothetical protein AeMF1_018349 [Aphanomyces euteiches]